MPLRAVLFDMDGVLIDSYRAWERIVQDARATWGFPPITAAQFAAGWGQGSVADVETFFPGHTVPEVEGFYHDRFPAVIEHLRAKPGAGEVLGALAARGLRRACVTNTPGALARRILEGLGLAAGLEVVLGGDEVPQSKPAPDLLLAALARFRCAPADALYVGDTMADVLAGRAAGVRTLGLGIQADAEIESLHEVLPAAGVALTPRPHNH